jgi:hypothetical protein
MLQVQKPGRISRSRKPRQTTFAKVFPSGFGIAALGELRQAFWGYIAAFR